MTPNQKELARHALGLNGRNKCSYRNHFVAGPAHRDYSDWVAMVAGGFAVRVDGKRLSFGGDDMFRMTRNGAQLALSKGESLDDEDFEQEGTKCST